MADRTKLGRFLLELCKKFKENNIKYVLIGGFAVIFYGYTRITQDIDFLIDASEENLKKIKKILKEVFNDDAFDEISTQDFEQYSVVRYGTPYNFYIDFIVKIGEIANFTDIYKKRKKINVEGIEIDIIDIEDLYRLKKDTLRGKDKQDAKFLKYVIENTNTNTNTNTKKKE